MTHIPLSSQPELQPDLQDLIACPSCDALYRIKAPADGERAVCARCHHLLITPKRGAILRIVLLGMTTLILLTGAVFLPFLQISAAGLHHASSIFDVALAFSGPRLAPLSIAVMALIVVIPLLRVLLTFYVLIPLLLNRPPLPAAARAFRLTEELRPWSMAEIFVIGVGVALVKLADLARVEIGPAFWMFAALVVITVLQDGFTCRWSIWKALRNPIRS